MSLARHKLFPGRRRLGLLLALFPLLSAAASGNGGAGNADDIPAALRETAMPEMGDSRLGKILGRYYSEGLGGAESWAGIKSLRIDGRMEIPGGELRVKAYQKKPNFLKMNIASASGSALTLAYDGEHAWKTAAGDREAAELMDEDEARRFAHGARFGSYLLYPYARGKQIEFVETLPVEGNVCHRIRVVLDTGYQVDYFIEVRSFLEMKVVNTDLRSGETRTLVYENYIREAGMSIARTVRSYENGEWTSTLTVEDAKVNSGVMPWMFRMPE